jgi:hypothetical protein
MSVSFQSWNVNMVYPADQVSEHTCFLLANFRGATYISDWPLGNVIVFLLKKCDMLSSLALLAKRKIPGFLVVMT